MSHPQIALSNNTFIDCECDECWAKDLIEKYPDLLKNFFTPKEVAEVWVNYSEEQCASWLYDDRETVYQVFQQARKFFEEGKPENFHWKIGRFFNVSKS